MTGSGDAKTTEDIKQDEIKNGEEEKPAMVETQGDSN
jgi:hypothetical protein